MNHDPVPGTITYFKAFCIEFRPIWILGTSRLPADMLEAENSYQFRGSENSAFHDEQLQFRGD